MSPANPPLDVDPETRARWTRIFTDLAFGEMDTLSNGPSVGAVGADGLDVAAEVSRAIPEEPLPGGAEAVAAVIDRALGASLRPAHAGYFAFIPGGGLLASALADFVADCANRFTGLTAAAPALCRLEADVIGWLAKEFGYGEEAGGVLLSGSSLANLSATVTARTKRFGDSGDFRRAVAYTSDQAHHCVEKALRLAGIPPANLRRISVDERYRLDVTELATRIREDRQAGREPFLVVAAAGTTNTGAVDPLAEIADLCRDENLWFHVDAAYGGAFVLCEEGRSLLSGIERADSIAFDPHKGLFLPFGTGCLLARDGRALRRAHTAGAHYLQDFDLRERSGEAPSPTDLGPELSRSYRGLRIWLPLMLHGAGAFREALAEKLELGRRFQTGLRRLVDGGAPLECVAPPQLSTAAFRLTRREGEELSDWNARNGALNEAVNARGRVFLSSTMLPVADGQAFTLRVSILGFRTHAEHVDACLGDLAASLC